jgi:hypothetical protein
MRTVWYGGAVWGLISACFGMSLARGAEADAKDKPDTPPLPAYRIEAAGFGAREADIRAVLDSAARELWRFFPDYTLEPIVVTRGRQAPITLYQRNDRGEIVMRLNTGDTYWSQYAYQFAHEFCHVLCGFREGNRRNRWFEEAVAETASLFAMRAMSRTWKRSPPYPHWADYRDALREYVDDVIRKRTKSYEIYERGLPVFYRTHQVELEREPTARELNGAMSLVLLQLFEQRPARWEAVRWLNRSPVDEGQTFQTYLQQWHDAAPAKHRAFVKQVADLYGVAIRSDAPAESLADAGDAPASPPAEKPAGEGAGERAVPKFRVEAQGFKAREQDIRAVLDSAARALWRHFPDHRIEPLVVVRGHKGPTVLFARNAAGEIVLQLDTENAYWCQYAYQFSYLFAEVLCAFSERSPGNKWFEVSVCEAASLFALKQMARTWERDPPYPNWKDYRHALGKYVQEAIDARLRLRPEELPEYYRKHREKLAQGQDTRPLCQAMSVLLLQLFEEQPEHWEALRWLNSAPSPAGESFEQYLQRWHDAVPAKHQPLVQRIAKLYGVTIKEKR